MKYISAFVCLKIYTSDVFLNHVLIELWPNPGPVCESGPGFINDSGSAVPQA